jgi:hypothetical protein
MYRIIRWTLVLVFLALPPVRAGAEPWEPQVPTQVPQHPYAEWQGFGTDEEVSSSDLVLPPLKAVLLVGPIDGDDGSWTTQEQENMERAAEELEANGVTVYRFYTPDNDWSQIKAAAEGAHFLLYRGHGVYWSAMPTPTVGGFALKNRFVSSDDIRNDLHLAPNAIVMLYGCFTAGSSSNDGGPITSQEAQRRVAQYSDPFFDVGAAGYYADWFGSAFQMYVRYLFQGMTLGEAYEAFFDFNSSTVERYTHPDHAGMAMWLDKDNWGHLQYNNAFAGLPDLSLEDLFSAPEMRVAPPEVTYLAEPGDPARSFAFEVDGGRGDGFGWTATLTPADAAWVGLAAGSGWSGDPLTVVITPTGQLPGVYEADVQVVAGTPTVANGVQGIAVTLQVLDHAYAVFLPAMLQ